MSTLKATNIKNESSASNNIVLDSGGGVVVSGILTATTFSGNVTIGAGSTSVPSLAPSGDSNTGIFFPAADTIAFAEGGTESSRFDSSGRLLVGTTNSAGTQLLKVNGSTSGSVFGGTMSLTQGRTPPNGSTLGVLNFGSEANPEGSSIAATAEGAWSAGSSQPSNLIFYTTPSASASQSERMRILSSGKFYLNTTNGSTPTVANTSFLDFGGASDTYGVYLQSHSATTAYLNRQADDGAIIDFRQAGVSEGSVSVSGTTVSYNGAHLSRWSQIPGIDPHDKDHRPEILRGTVMSNLDEMCDWTDPETGEAQANEQLNKTKISDVEGDKNVAGIFQSWDDDDDTWVNDFYLAMTGDFVIRIGAGVTVERGDLLMSAGDGTAKPQDDDIIRSKTIAKVTSTNVSCTYDDGSYCVPCVLMAC